MGSDASTRSATPTRAKPTNAQDLPAWEQEQVADYKKNLANATARNQEKLSRGDIALEQGPVDPRISPDQIKADMAAARADKRTTDLLTSQTSEAKALGVSTADVQSGVGRTGYGLNTNVSSALGLDATVDPDKKRLLGL